MSRKPHKPGLTPEERRTADDRRDAAFFTDRKAREAANLEKTLRLRAQRLAHEAAQPQPEKSPVKRKAAKSAG
jgi:hypothetical protein